MSLAVKTHVGVILAEHLPQPLVMDDEIAAVAEASNANDKWDANSLMRSLGVA